MSSLNSEKLRECLTQRRWQKKGPIKELRQQRLKSNSTSTLYVKNTISNPDDEEIVRCMSVALYYHILKGHENSNPFFLDVFSEKLYPLTNGYIDFDKPPEAESVYKFVSTIFHAEKLALECVILCLSYVEKVAEATGLTLHASNWRRVTLSSIILASKVWEEQAVWNVDFLSIFPNVTVRDLNKMEKKLLEALQYNVTLGAGMYAKYYFELRALSDLDENTFPLKPLDKHSAEKLEEKAQTQQKRIRKTTRRTLSMDSFHLLTTKSPLVILS
eukprot:TRINITY_DN1130_c0_g1_i3.p1 TRINITY_DN1130_c0_g1~~TRINITY_DN1130_c0_g1_i3.p1  ORF type:complete len:273 (-),score=55.91 TRINITY_DN1130_c0_g1_i3:191-1009(-)